MSALRHALLDGLHVEHGFGTRASPAPETLLRPKQVHGTRVVALDAALPLPATLGEADAVVSLRRGLAIGVVTADCLPILVATPAGAVAAVHAGWRGLAEGVVGAALDALSRLTADVAHGVAVIGPHIHAGCYEVDAPVVDALSRRFAADLGDALAATRPGHWRLDLARLARADLVRSGLAAARVATLSGACTACDAERFFSYRRDGPRAGRLVHWIAARTEGPARALDTPVGPA
jgi:YfiH family protein